MEASSDNKKGKKTAKSARSILGGAFLSNEKSLKSLPFFLFLAFLGIIYIGNSYYAEKNIRRIDRLQNEVKELRYEFVTTKSKLMQRCRQSNLLKSLGKKGIKESTIPPKKIYGNVR